jgi:hypothetical protein
MIKKKKEKIIENMRTLSFWTWLTLFKMMFSRSMHLPENNKISFLFMAE